MNAATRRERIETDAIALENFRRRAGARAPARAGARRRSEKIFRRSPPISGAFPGILPFAAKATEN